LSTQLIRVHKNATLARWRYFNHCIHCSLCQMSPFDCNIYWIFQISIALYQTMTSDIQYIQCI